MEDDEAARRDPEAQRDPEAWWSRSRARGSTQTELPEQRCRGEVASARGQLKGPSRHRAQSSMVKSSAQTRNVQRDTHKTVYEQQKSRCTQARTSDREGTRGWQWREERGTLGTAVSQPGTGETRGARGPEASRDRGPPWGGERLRHTSDTLYRGFLRHPLLPGRKGEMTMLETEVEGPRTATCDRPGQAWA